MRDFGAAMGVGVELDPLRVHEATRNAKVAGVDDRVYFLTQDLFEADLSAATVVTLYLLPAVNRLLVPKLRGLTFGTRNVSHDYDLGPDWKPDAREVLGNRTVYLFTVGAR